MRPTKFLSMVALAGCAVFMGASQAQAAFTTTAAGPIASADAVGNSGNGSFTGTYTGANTIFSSLSFSGTLTEVLTATFASEARWRVSNLNTGGFGDFQPTTTTSFTGSINVTKTVGVLAWANMADTYKFEAFESLNDGAGADANWTNVNFTFDGATAINDIGDFASGTSFLLDTEGSSFDTELALYTAGGTLIGNDDDSGTGLLSLFNAGVLPIGTYYFVGSGFNSGFGNGFAFAGSAAGTLNMRINGGVVSNGALGAGTFKVNRFDVVPEPASMVALGLGVAALLRRRRK